MMIGWQGSVNGCLHDVGVCKVKISELAEAMVRWRTVSMNHAPMRMMLIVLDYAQSSLNHCSKPFRLFHITTYC